MFGEYRCAAEQVQFAQTLDEKQLSENNRKLAISAAVAAVTRFQWRNPPLAVFEDVQQRLYDKRL